MTPRGDSLRVPLALSLAAHAGALGLLLLGGHLAWPTPPIPIEVRPHHRVVARVGDSERRAPATPAAADKPAPQRRQTGASRRAAADKAGAAKATPPQTTDLAPFAPADAHLVVLLRMDKLRRSPHRAGVEALLGALPDWATLVRGSGVSPIDDFEALLIATADPFDVTATFLAARHRDTPKLRALAERSLGPGDPRVFRVLAPGLTVLTRPDDARRLDHPPDLGVDAHAAWLVRLAEFDRVAAAPDGPALVVTIADLTSLVRFGADLPTPQAIALAATAEPAPAVHARLAFATAADAAAFARAWPEVVARYRRLTVLIGLGSALDGVRIHNKEAEVELEGRIPEGQMRLALSWSRAFLPHEAAPEPPEPEDEPPARTPSTPLDRAAPPQ